MLGLRADRYAFDVTSDLPANSGTADDSLLSPKMSLVYAFDDAAEVYLSPGRGFHSNDARGTTIAVDPKTGDPADPSTLSFPRAQAKSACARSSRNA